MSEVLIKEYRGNIVENVHRGSIAIVSSTGDTVAYLGDIEKQTYISQQTYTGPAYTSGRTSQKIQPHG